jgi:hypothetical protein
MAVPWAPLSRVVCGLSLTAAAFVVAPVFGASVAFAEVGPRGSFQTRVGLEVPAYRGLEPDLSLTYDSHRSEGPLGVGWALVGLSQIERVSPGGECSHHDCVAIDHPDDHGPDRLSALSLWRRLVATATAAPGTGTRRAGP